MSDGKPIRALMYDYARGQCVRPDYLKHLVDFAADNHYTCLSIYIEDWALFFEDKDYRGSLDAAVLKLIVAYGVKKGITVIPLLAMLGHSEQTLAHSSFAGIAEEGSQDCIDLYLPRAKKLAAELVERVCDIFPSPWIHVGFDECWDMGRSLFRHGLANKHKINVFFDHLVFVSGLVEKRGRRAMFWSDIISRYLPAHMRRLPESVMPVDWCYNPIKIYPTISNWAHLGYDVVAGPAAGTSGDFMFPHIAQHAENIESISRFARLAGSEDILITSWEYSNRTPIFFDDILSVYQWGGELFAHDTGWRNYFNSSPERKIAVALGDLARQIPSPLHDMDLDFEKHRHFWHSHTEGAAEKMGRLVEQHRQIIHDIDKLKKGNDINCKRLQLAADRLGIALDLLNHKSDKKALPERISSVAFRCREQWLLERHPDIFDTRHAPTFEKMIDLVKHTAGKKIAIVKHQRKTITCSRKKPDIPQISGFRQFSSHNLAEENTEISLRRNEDALMISVKCRQKSAPHACNDIRDYALTGDDHIELTLSPYPATGDVFWFIVTANGSCFSEFMNDDLGQRWEDPRFNTKITARPSKGNGWWGAEIVIRFVDLGVTPPAIGDHWGIASARRAGRPQVITCWGGTGCMARPRAEHLETLIFS
jgi:hypothetical protein